MASLLELTERINKGELIDPQLLEVYQSSTNAAEKFLANHAGAMLDLRRSHTHLSEALEAIDFADQKVLFQYLSVLGFLGMADQRTRAVIRFGAAAVNRRETALALEAFQSSVTADATCDGPSVREPDLVDFVARQYERAAAAIGWYPPGPIDWKNPQLKIGYVTTTLADDDAPARLIAGFARHLDVKHAKLHVYSTESAVRREKQVFTQGPFLQPSSKKGRDTLDLLTRRKAVVWTAPLDHDLAQTARDLAAQVFKDQIDVLILDAGPCDPVASVLACWKPARATLHVVRRLPLRSGEADAAVYFDAHRRHAHAPFWQSAQTPTHLLADGVEPPAPDVPAPQRSALGIPDSAVVLATHLDAADGPVCPDFVDTVLAALRQNPTAVLLAAGDADTTVLKRRLDAAGLAKRAGFTGRRKDLVEHLRVADLYLAPFGRPASVGLLSAMSAGRCCVALNGDASDPHRPAAVLGDDQTVPDSSAYVARVARLVADPQQRVKTGDANRQAVAGRFAMEQTVRGLESLCRTLIETPADQQPPMAQAA